MIPNTVHPRCRGRDWAAAAVLIAATLVAYSPAMSSGFIWDDNDYVTDNPALRDPGGLIRIWTKPGATPQYYPLVFTSFWIEHALWGLRPAGYHVVNVLLHAASAVLLWRALRSLGYSAAWFAAAIFALHPVQVESVAWITERKNVLSGVLYLAALLSYLRFAGLGRGLGGRARDYATSFALFVAALLSKSVSCSLPAALGLILYWKRPHVRLPDLLPLLPMLFVGAAMAYVTVWVETHVVGTRHVDLGLSPVDRILVAGRACWFYAGKLIWPYPLAFSYARWVIDARQAWQFAFPAAALAAVAAAWFARKRIGKGPLVALLYFGGTLLPALGFVDVFPMIYSWVADHFQYMAAIGPITLIAGGLGAAASRCTEARRRPVRAAPPVLAGALLLGLAGLTWRQGLIYLDLESLYRDTLAKNPDSWMAHYNLALVLEQSGREDEAFEHYRRYVEIKPDDDEPYNKMGMILARRGEIAAAMAQFEAALATKPGSALSRNNLGFAMERLGRRSEALEQYREAVRLKPEFALPHYNLLRLAGELGVVSELLHYYGQLIASDPRNAALRYYFGRVLESERRVTEAIREYREVLAIDSRHVEARARLAGLGVSTP